MIQLTYPEIDRICIYAINKTPAHLPEIKACLELMYVTGARAQESFDKTKWNLKNPSIYILLPQKKSIERIFNDSELPGKWKDFINNGDRMTTYVNYRKLQYSLQQIISHFQIKTGDKECLAHLFRHNYIKRLQYFNHPDTEIQTLIGHRSIDSTKKYLNAKIFAKYLP